MGVGPLVLVNDQDNHLSRALLAIQGVREVVIFDDPAAQPLLFATLVTCTASAEAEVRRVAHSMRMFTTKNLLGVRIVEDRSGPAND